MTSTPTAGGRPRRSSGAMASGQSNAEYGHALCAAADALARTVGVRCTRLALADADVRRAGLTRGAGGHRLPAADGGNERRAAGTPDALVLTLAVGLAAGAVWLGAVAEAHRVDPDAGTGIREW